MRRRDLLHLLGETKRYLHRRFYARGRFVPIYVALAVHRDGRGALRAQRTGNDQRVQFHLRRINDTLNAY